VQFYSGFKLQTKLIIDYLFTKNNFKDGVSTKDRPQQGINNVLNQQYYYNMLILMQQTQ